MLLGKMGRRKKALPPRAKRMKRAARLESAKHWIPKYSGKDLVRGYEKHFGVDLLCAALELQMLGAAVDAGRVASLRATALTKGVDRRRRKERESEEGPVEVLDEDDCWADEFAYVAGYTAGGLPYGVGWEETEHESRDDDTNEE